ncbi:MAG: GH1 family beta-glucosidase [Actinomyces sp.]|jgi:beta-glucosidase|nr:GH1 family beta-glucosidase [Actinomyces sp.]MCI1787797.1 GH1 family beta-glucosidase [Actinomyces sp.]MCI1829867.1 GH1 family beta-glucosidase [Actinomyces sp.]
MSHRLDFPRGFRWGAATAAAQIEGAGREDGKGDSIWDALCRRPGAIADGSDIEVACDHYHRMPEDVALMRELGIGTYRFSVSWARVMPDGRTVNPAGLDFYSRLIDRLSEAGIRPWLTLYHWDLPERLQQAGGWVNRDTASLFADYAGAVYDRLGGRVPTWTTLNEPWCSSMLSYAAGEHAPGHADPVEAVAAVHHLLLAHGQAVEVLRERAARAGESPEIGLTLNFTVAHPADPSSEADRDAARRIDGLRNRLFTDPVFRGEYPEDVLQDMRSGAGADLARFVRPGDLELIGAPIDVLGVNFYNGEMVAGAAEASSSPAPDPLVRHDRFGFPHRSANIGSEWVRSVPRGLPRTDMGWEVEPDDLRRLLVRLHRDYTGPAGIPLVVTENGAAYADRPDAAGFVDDAAPDDSRTAYIRDHLAAVHRAIQEGADVDGYLVWSLLDNFEWALGYTKRFGIVHVDYETQERTPKASALWYRDVIAANAVTME